MTRDEELKIKRAKMLEDIKTMDKEAIMDTLVKMGCGMPYEEIVAKLGKTYNDLSVADEIFNTYQIDDSMQIYPQEFVDLAISEIVKRIEKFPFIHYGVISDEIYELSDAAMDDEEKIAKLEEAFRKFFKLCKTFKLENFDQIQYEVNDGLDLHSVIIDYLDECMEKGRMKDQMYYHKIIDFCTRFMKQFPKVNEYLGYSVRCELATVYVALKDPKGEKMFLESLKNHRDKTEAVLHYGLAYLDDDPKRTIKIFKRYENMLNKESDCYEIIQQIITDCGKLS